MKKINVADVPVEERTSPKGRFHVRQRHISLALGAQKDVGTWGGGHPFDVAEVTVPPGKTNWPFHYHSAQWEFFLVKSGRGLIRTPEGYEALCAGDAFVRKPGEPHQIRNDGDEDLVLLILADNPPADVVGYPDTGQWFIKPARKLLTGNERDYYSGEE